MCILYNLYLVSSMELFVIAPMVMIYDQGDLINIFILFMLIINNKSIIVVYFACFKLF